MNSRQRLEKALLRARALYYTHRNGLWIGIVGAGLMVACLGMPDEETRTIFKREAALDFKGADILGNPRQSILRGEEAHFSKTQRTVLETQDTLKAEVAALRISIRELQTQPFPSPSAQLAYGPWPLPSQGTSPAPLPSVSPMPSPAPVGRATDQARHTQAAPERNGDFGMSESGRQSAKVRLGNNRVSFPVKSTGKAFLKKPGIILPSGSYVKAVLLTGVEAPEGKTYPVLLQLDFAYVIPNDKRLDLAGCFMIAKAQGDLSTERVQMQATKISCVSKQGGMFEREVNGFVADDADNSFAVVGRVNSKQDRVASTAFLSSIVAGIGKAIQQAQTASQTTPLGGSQSVITGDQAKYLAGGGAAEAATLVTQWYLKQAQNLLPTINVGSGQSVWVVMQDQVDLPKDYFNQSAHGGSSNASIYSHFTRLLD